MEPYSPYLNREIATILTHEDLPFSHDVPSLISLSRTCQDARKSSNDLIFRQFTNLLDYCSKTFESSTRTPENFILHRLRWVESSMVSKKDEDGCTELKLFKKAFNNLKMLYNLLPEKSQKEILQLNCPSLIKEMVSPDLASSLSLEILFDVLREFKKIGLLVDNNPDEQLYKIIPSGYAGCSLQEFCGILYITTFENNKHTKSRTVIFQLSNESKWEAVKSVFNKLFSIVEGENLLITLTEFEDEIQRQKKELYEKIRHYVTQLDKFTPETNPVLKLNQYCIRLSGSEKDIYNNPKLVFNIKLPNGNTGNMRIDNLPEMKSTEDFDKTLSDILIFYKYQPQ